MPEANSNISVALRNEQPELRTTTLIFGGITLILLGAVVSTGTGLFGVIILLAGTALVASAADDDAHRVVLLAVLIPFDLQREVLRHWLYLDSLFIVSAVPLWRRKSICKPTLIPLAYLAFIVATGATRTLNATWFWGYVSRLVVAWLFTNAVAISRLKERGILAIGASLPVLTLVGLWQVISGDFGTIFEFINPHMVDQPWLDRAFSTMWHPNAFGGFCALVSCALLALALSGVRTKLASSLAAFGVIGTVASGSRGALVAFTVAAIVMFVITGKIGKVLLVALLVGALLVPIILSFDSLPLQRMEQVDSFTANTRLYLYFLAFQMFVEHPIAGVGTMNFQEFLSDTDWNLNSANTHSLYLQVLSENGTAGFLLAAGAFSWLMWHFWKRRKNPFALAGLGSLVCVAINGGVDFLLVHPHYLLALAMIVGCAFGEEPDSIYWHGKA